MAEGVPPCKVGSISKESAYAYCFVAPSSPLGKTPPQPAATAAKRIRRPEKRQKTMASFQFVNLTETLRHDDDSKTSFVLRQ